VKNWVFIFILFLTTFTSYSQYTLRLVVTSVATKSDDDIYLTGTFNNWDPYDLHYKLKPFGRTRKAIVLYNQPAGKFEFKFTRAGWARVETTSTGKDIENRVINLQSDSSINIDIAGWKDNFPDKPKPSTASSNVKIIDTAFSIPQLNRHRRIWVYLPASYQTLKSKAYPVLYMQDGQNLFNEQTAPFGEWGIDECLDSLQRMYGKECIVVGIDNGDDKRMNEYNPYDNDKFGKGEGKLYVDFLAKTLKPFIDKVYRTQKDAAHTYIAGSSMGGLIAMYAMLKYPAVFGAAGIFSPAFWVAPSIYKETANAKMNCQQRFFFYAGAKESETMVTDMQQLEEVIREKKCSGFLEDINPDGQHNEKYWRQEFDDFYFWLME
jgi:predicted alpha/beta superfamily hydrolase